MSVCVWGVCVCVCLCVRTCVHYIHNAHVCTYVRNVHVCMCVLAVSLCVYTYVAASSGPDPSPQADTSTTAGRQCVSVYSVLKAL